MSVLEARKLTVGYGSGDVLAGLDFRAEVGKITALLGPNAAGKTTLLRVMARQLRPRLGEIHVDGAAIWSMSNRACARAIGYAPQDETGAMSLTVEETVAMGRAPHRGWFLPLTRDDRTVVDASIVRLQLDHVRQRAIHTLSGGERQRATLARVLAQQPRWLLLDEPTAHLDPRHQVDLFSLLRELAGEGVSTVVTLHDLNQAARWADHVVLLNHGRIDAEGDPAAALTPENLRRVYGVDASVIHDQRHDRPVISFIGATNQTD